MIAVGIDVSKSKSTIAILSSTGEILMKPGIQNILTSNTADPEDNFLYRFIEKTINQILIVDSS